MTTTSSRPTVRRAKPLRKGASSACPKFFVSHMISREYEQAGHSLAKIARELVESDEYSDKAIRALDAALNVAPDENTAEDAVFEWMGKYLPRCLELVWEAVDHEAGSSLPFTVQEPFKTGIADAIEAGRI